MSRIRYAELVTPRERRRRGRQARPSDFSGVTRRDIRRVSVYSRMSEAFAEGKASMRERHRCERRGEIKARYRAATESRYRSSSPSTLGGSADAHYAWGDDYWQLREDARRFDRDFPVIGQAVDRNLDNLLADGLTWDPQTSSRDWNAEALAALDDWAGDPAKCDFSGRFTFDELERLAHRHMDVDGDAFVILDEETGTVRLIEGDRVTSPRGLFELPSGNDLIHGVELEAETGRPVGYYFRERDARDRLRQTGSRGGVSLQQLRRVDAADVIHVYEPKRVSQHRGITAFHAVFERISLLEDTEFAELVKQQVASCIAAFIHSEHPFRLGARSSEESEDGTEVSFDELSPGMIVPLPPGASVTAFSPSVQTGDAREQAKQIVREIGLALGMPLELTMLITSDTTFHGYRGVVEMYKRTARVKQAKFGRRLRSRVYRWVLGRMIARGVLSAPPADGTEARHVLRAPGWSYVDPAKEVSADQQRLEGYMASHRQVWRERGRDWDDGVREIVEDRAALILAAHHEALDLSEGADGKPGVPDVSWRDVLGLQAQTPPPGGSPPAVDPSGRQERAE